MLNDPRFQALLRESGIASAMVGRGATLLARANYAQKEIYYQAFFDLSVGFERTAKLILILDHAIEKSGAFPNDRELRAYSHDLERLLKSVERIFRRRGLGREGSLLSITGIHLGVVEVLKDFALSTRYYNLDFLVAGKAASLPEPVKHWHNKVGEPILAEHYSSRQKTRAQAGAKIIQSLYGATTMVRHTAESGEAIDSLEVGMLRSAENRIVQRWSQLYVLQIIRHLAGVLWDLEVIAHQQGLDFVPFVHELFAMFYNDDRYLRSRKTWTRFA